MFNTLKYVKIIEGLGFTREQAETSIKVLVEIMEDKLATKEEMKDLKNEFQLFRTEMKHEMKIEMKELESRLTLRMGAMFVATITILSGVMTMIQLVPKN